MESQDREQGTPQRRLSGDEGSQDEAMSDDAGYDDAEAKAKQDEGENEPPAPGAG